MLLPYLVDLLGADLHLASFHGLDVRIGHVEQFRVETDLPAVVRDVEHVVVRRVHGSVTHQFRPLHERVHGLFLRFGRLDGDGDHVAVGHVQVKLVGGQQVRVVVERAHQFGQVVDFANRCLIWYPLPSGLTSTLSTMPAVRCWPAGERLPRPGL